MPSISMYVNDKTEDIYLPLDGKKTNETHNTEIEYGAIVTPIVDFIHDVVASTQTITPYKNKVKRKRLPKKSFTFSPYSKNNRKSKASSKRKDKLLNPECSSERIERILNTDTSIFPQSEQSIAV